MSIVLPFLAPLLPGALVAYHLMRLVAWTLDTPVLLRPPPTPPPRGLLPSACSFAGVTQTAITVAVAILALYSVPVPQPCLRKPLITPPFMGVFRKVLPPLSKTERIALETGSVGS